MDISKNMLLMLINCGRVADQLFLLYMAVFDFLMLTIVMVLSFQAQSLSSQNLTCNPNDLKALKDFMTGLETVIDGWNTDFSSNNCCSWTGITCNSNSSSSSSSLGLDNPIRTSRVVKFELPRKKLVGTLLESLGTMDQLRVLNLSQNFLKGTLPVSLFHFRNLQVLDLSFNYFSGPVPATIYLPSIQILDLSRNLLEGYLPVSICDNNSRTLRVLNLAANYFSGNIPIELGNCGGSLKQLYVASNDLTGEVTEGIFRLRKLSVLNLQDNKFSGPMRKGFGSLTNLVSLDISSNGFTGIIPDVFHNFAKLKYFVVHSNCFNGFIPSSLSNSPILTSLNMRNNSLEGSVVINCSAMVSLTFLDLSSNRFTGPIPDNLPYCKRLNNVNLARNRLGSLLPESFKDFHSLSYLSLSNTSIYNLSSALKILQNCLKLSTLVLSMNFHNEELPADTSLYFKNLKALIIANCKLTGSIPQWLSNSRKLQLLDLSWNCLSGTIPTWLSNFGFLFYMDLSNNSLTGVIPKNISGLKSLIDRDISLEEPSPNFPFFMKSNLNKRGLQYNQLSSFPPTLDLSYNNLSGQIWPEFGILRKLHVLVLKFNNISGPIPSSLSGMTSLETLDLSHNKLSGTVPQSLVKLSFLSKFNVADNLLYGEIPSGGQFSTFPTSSFEGNNLCGDHVLRCESVHQFPSRPPDHHDEDEPHSSFVIAMAIGFAFGFCSSIVYCNIERINPLLKLETMVLKPKKVRNTTAAW